MKKISIKFKQNFKVYTACAMCVVMLFSMFMMTGCKGSKEANKEINKDIEFLLASEYWYHYDEVTGESEKMRFNEDLTFYWGCVCGEPVGDSDCYELFSYDKETSIIKLYNDYDDMSMEMEVLDYSDYHLLLRYDGKIKDYTYNETGLDLADNGGYVADYSGEFSILEGNTEEVVLGPFDYDGDVKYPDNAKKTYKLAEDVETYKLFTFRHIKDGEIDEDTVDYGAISMEEALYHIEYGGYGFIWFNENLEVSKILLYGATVAEE